VAAPLAYVPLGSGGVAEEGVVRVFFGEEGIGGQEGLHEEDTAEGGLPSLSPHPPLPQGRNGLVEEPGEALVAA
jgi:hypothetical protein